MKYSKRIICLITAFLMASSLASCSEGKQESEISETVQENTEEIQKEEPENVVEYKLTDYYYESELPFSGGTEGTVNLAAFGGDHLYYITDDIVYSSGTGYRMRDIDAFTFKKSDYYGAPSGYTLPESITEYTDSTTGAAFSADMIEGADRVCSVSNGVALYINEEGAFQYDIKTKKSKKICGAEESELPIAGIYSYGTKFTIVYEEPPQVMKRFYSADADGKVNEEAKMTFGDKSALANTCVSRDGDLYFTKVESGTEVTTVKWKKTEVPVSRAEIYKMSTDGNLTRIVKMEKEYIQCEIRALVVSDDDDIFCVRNNLNGETVVQRYNQGGTLISENVIPDIASIDEFFCSGSDLWVLYKGEEDKKYFAPLENGIIATDRKMTVPLCEGTVFHGNESYDIYITDSVTMYGCNVSERKIEPVMNWTDSDISFSQCQCIGVGSSGDIYSISFDSEESGSPFRILRLKKADETRLAEINRKKIITVAGETGSRFSDTESGFIFSEKVREFNKNSDEYYIHTVNYLNYSGTGENEGFTGGMDQLHTDIAENGYSPDIIVYSSDSADIQQFVNEDRFIDFKELMEEDPEISTDDIPENISDVCTQNGVMYRLFPYYKGWTFAQDVSYADKDSLWAFRDYYSVVSPDDEKYYYDTYDMQAFEDMLSSFISTHVDFENKTCDFDNVAFRALLKWAGAFMSSEEYFENGYDQHSAEYATLRRVDLSNPAGLEVVQAEADDEQYIRGIPSDDGIGMQIEPGLSFSVLKTTGAREGAWQFIRQFFTDEFYGYTDETENDTERMTSMISSEFLPVRKSVMEKRIEDSVSLKYEHILYGEDYTPVYNLYGSQYSIDEVTEKTAEKFRKAVNSPVCVDMRGTKLWDIITSEAKRYFSEESSAEKTSSAVQLRVSDYLNKL